MLKNGRNAQQHSGQCLTWEVTTFLLKSGDFGCCAPTVWCSTPKVQHKETVYKPKCKNPNQHQSDSFTPYIAGVGATNQKLEKDPIVHH